MNFPYNNKKTAGALLFAAGAQFVVFLVVAEAVYPNYSISGNYISDLGVWGKASAAIFNPSIFVFGLFVLTAGYFLHKEYRFGLFSVVVGLAGLGAMGVGVFPENTVIVNGLPLVHSIAALGAFVFGAISAIVSSKIVKPPFRYFSLLLGAASLLSLVLFIVTRSQGHIDIGEGGMERMIVYPTLLWTIGLGGYLMSNPNTN